MISPKTEPELDNTDNDNKRNENNVNLLVQANCRKSVRLIDQGLPKTSTA
jgi:hypothetical protein